MNLIVTHAHGDFDALASLVAAAKIYPDSNAILPEPVNENVRNFVNLYRDLLPLRKFAEIEGVPKVAVIVDTRQKSRLGPALELVQQAAEIHIYDHHPADDDDLEGTEVRVEAVGATTTLLVEEIRRREIPLTEVEATLLALGIYEDTASLTGGSTTARDAAAVAYLWEQGLQSELIQEYLRTPLSTAQKTLLEKLVDGSEYFALRKRRILLCSASMDEYVRGVAVLLKFLQETEQVELAIVLVQMEKGLYLAARALPDDLNLLELLSPMGVKGHRGAVSASIKTKDLAAAREQLLELLETYLPPAATAEQVASAPLFTVRSEQTVREVMDLLFDKGYSGCPVMDDGKLSGIISRRDLQKALRSDLGHAPVKGFMKRRVTVAAPGDSVTALRRTMVEQNIGRIPIVGGAGEPVGIVTRTDILRFLHRLDSRGESLEQNASLLNLQGDDPVTQVDNMVPLINRELPGRMQSLLLMTGQWAEKAGARIYLVGGVIRDLLLGQAYPKDLDFVVLPDAVAFARELQKFLGGKLRIFEQFGTASLFLDQGLRLDLATARKEYYAAPAALPQVEETNSLKNDLFRRDFTINTLACSLMPGSFGILYDFFSGREDLSRGIIRTLYNLSFVDDPLRILRAARFEQRFAFKIEDGTMELIGRAINSKVLDKLSRPRLNQEVALIYREPDPVRVLRRLDEFGALSFIYPRMRTDLQTWQRLNKIGEALDWAARRDWESRPAPEAELVYLCGLLYDLESEERSVIMRRLQFSRERTETVLTACKEAPRALEELSRDNPRHSVLAKRLDPFSAEALLLIYATAEGRKIRNYLKLYLDSLQHVRPRLKGGDLKQLGLEPSPLYQEILQALREAVLDGKVRTSGEEMDFILAYLKQREES